MVNPNVDVESRAGRGLFFALILFALALLLAAAQSRPPAANLRRLSAFRLWANGF